MQLKKAYRKLRRKRKSKNKVDFLKNFFSVDMNSNRYQANNVIMCLLGRERRWEKLGRFDERGGKGEKKSGQCENILSLILLLLPTLWVKKKNHSILQKLATMLTQIPIAFGLLLGEHFLHSQIYSVILQITMFHIPAWILISACLLTCWETQWGLTTSIYFYFVSIRWTTFLALVNSAAHENNAEQNGVIGWVSLIDEVIAGLASRMNSISSISR